MAQPFDMRRSSRVFWLIRSAFPLVGTRARPTPSTYTCLAGALRRLLSSSLHNALPLASLPLTFSRVHLRSQARCPCELPQRGRPESLPGICNPRAPRLVVCARARRVFLFPRTAYLSVRPLALLSIHPACPCPAPSHPCLRSRHRASPSLIRHSCASPPVRLARFCYTTYSLGGSIVTFPHALCNLEADQELSFSGRVLRGSDVCQRKDLYGVFRRKREWEMWGCGTRCSVCGVGGRGAGQVQPLEDGVP
ncbi:hypothetical protein B0H14DRAFT_2923643 [Mycena olivaceomarginata]|nr:hypothetical protein B0H14DRAFT_2923643 [Mycena olivaceomarginata]